MTVPRRPGGAQRIPEPTRRRDAGPPVWTGREASFDLTTVVARLVEHESARAEAPSPEPHERVSAVLLALVDGPRGAEVLLTRRTEHLSSHRGEISFPGGRLDEGEDVVSAARREADEEVGIDPSSVRVVARLSPISTFVSRSFIVPVVATIEQRPELRPNPSEVDRAFWTPLVELVRADTFDWEWWTFSRRDDTERPMFFFHLDDETVWGATARLLHELLCVVHGANHFDLPAW